MRTAVRAALASLALVVAVLLVAGWRPVVLRSDSMAPTAPAGSLLVARPVAPDDVRVGDVVTVPLGADERLTHRVVAVDAVDGAVHARLRGDANDAPDPYRVELPDPTLRAVLVVPGVGWLIGTPDPVLLAGLGLLAIAGTVIAALRREPPPRTRDHTPATAPDSETPEAGDEPTPPAPVDPRLLALAATLEAHAEQGLPREDLVALARVRSGPVLGLPPVERSGIAAALDDGARFVLLAYVDADADALGIVPSASLRAQAARGAVEAWWDAVVDRVPVDVRRQLDDVLPVTGARGGITGIGLVD